MQFLCCGYTLLYVAGFQPPDQYRNLTILSRRIRPTMSQLWSWPISRGGYPLDSPDPNP